MDMKIPTVCLGRQAAKCYTGLSMLEARKPQHNPKHHWKIPLKFLSLPLVECSSIEYWSCSVPDLASFPAIQLGCFPSRALTAWHGQGLEGAGHLGSWTWWSSICARHQAWLWASDMTKTLFCTQGLISQEDTDPGAAERLVTVPQGPSTGKRDQLSFVGVAWPAKCGWQSLGPLNVLC